MLKKIILFLLIFSTSNVFGKKLIILTDEPSGAKAEKIRKLINQTPPFNFLKKSEFSVAVKIIQSEENKFKCEPLTIKYTDAEIASLEYYAKEAGIILTAADKKKYKEGYTINRLVQCDHAALVTAGIEHQAEHLIFVRNSPYEGGSGGDIPIILSGSREGIGLHEWMHSFGLADEYAYSKEEAPFYCRSKIFANVAIFNDTPPYASDEDVRIRHRDQIPWLTYLRPTAKLITNDQLGSPVRGDLGIFRANTCNIVVPSLKSWKPTSYPTVMENPHTNYIPKPYWTPILSGLGVTDERITELLKRSVKPEWLINTSTTAPINPPTPLGTEPAKDL